MSYTAPAELGEETWTVRHLILFEVVVFVSKRKGCPKRTSWTQCSRTWNTSMCLSSCESSKLQGSRACPIVGINLPSADLISVLHSGPEIMGMLFRRT